MKRVILLVAAMCVALSSGGHTEPIDASSIAVVDGDTIDVGPDRYRMVGYDTPEVRTP